MTKDERQAMTDDERPRCGNCAFWERNKHGSGVSGYHCNGRASNCRRYAPTNLDPSRKPSDTATWPTTDLNAWCGEYLPSGDHHK